MKISAGRWPDRRGDLGQVDGGLRLARVDLLPYPIGWSAQVPDRRAAERDEAKIAAWREEAWPVLKGPRRTWAPG
jgi:hypothetical protein